MIICNIQEEYVSFQRGERFVSLKRGNSDYQEAFNSFENYYLRVLARDFRDRDVRAVAVRLNFCAFMLRGEE